MKIMRSALMHGLNPGLTVPDLPSTTLKHATLTNTAPYVKCIVSLLVVLSLSACSHIRQSSSLSSEPSKNDAGPVDSSQADQATTEAARAYLAMLQGKDASSTSADSTAAADKQQSQQAVAQPMTEYSAPVAQAEPEAKVISKEPEVQAISKEQSVQPEKLKVASATASPVFQPTTVEPTAIKPAAVKTTAVKTTMVKPETVETAPVISTSVEPAIVAGVQEQAKPRAEQPVVTEQAAIDEVNRLTEAQPTAAIVKNYQVLPEVETSVKEVSVPKEILLLAPSADYTPKVSEYGMWKIAKGDQSLYRENCTLASTSMQVALDNYSTQIWLNVVGDDLLVNSTTNIDIRKPRVGVKLDNGPLQPFNKKHYATSAVWSGDLKKALQNNKHLSVVIGGDELGNRTKEVAVELDDLKRAYSEYTKCNANTRIGSL